MVKKLIDRFWYINRFENLIKRKSPIMGIYFNRRLPILKKILKIKMKYLFFIRLIKIKILIDFIFIKIYFV